MNKKNGINRTSNNVTILTVFHDMMCRYYVLPFRSATRNPYTSYEKNRLYSVFLSAIGENEKIVSFDFDVTDEIVSIMKDMDNLSDTAEKSYNEIKNFLTENKRENDFMILLKLTGLLFYSEDFNSFCHEKLTVNSFDFMFYLLRFFSSEELKEHSVSSPELLISCYSRYKIQDYLKEIENVKKENPEENGFGSNVSGVYPEACMLPVNDEELAILESGEEVFPYYFTDSRDRNYTRAGNTIVFTAEDNPEKRYTFIVTGRTVYGSFTEMFYKNGKLVKTVGAEDIGAACKKMEERYSCVDSIDGAMLLYLKKTEDRHIAAEDA